MAPMCNIIYLSSGISTSFELHQAKFTKDIPGGQKRYLVTRSQGHLSGILVPGIKKKKKSVQDKIFGIRCKGKV